VAGNIFPHDHERPAELLMDYVQELGVVLFGEAFALVAGPTGAGAVDQS
jgi:hypothetical protein